MGYLIDKARKIFEKVKPVLMSEVNIDSSVQEIAPVIPQEKTDLLVSAKVESQAGELSSSPKAGALSLTTALINGAGVGLLLGALLGLSISPVVSGVIGTLSGLLAVFLGISEKYMSPLKSIRIGAFGFFCVAGIILGMYIRTNKGLLPSRQKMMQEYTAVGFTKEEARDFIAYREFGLVPGGWTGKQTEVKDQNQVQASEPVQQPDSGKPVGNTNTAAVNPVVKISQRQFANPNQTAVEFSNVLYSSEVDAAECYKLSIANSSQPVAEIKNTFERAGGTWKELAQNLDVGLPEKIYIQALFTMRDCFCQSGQSGKLKVLMTGTIKKISSDQSLEQIRKILSDTGGTWTTIVERINIDIPSEYQKTLYLALIKIFKS